MTSIICKFSASNVAPPQGSKCQAPSLLSFEILTKRSLTTSLLLNNCHQNVGHTRLMESNHHGNKPM